VDHLGRHRENGSVDEEDKVKIKTETERRFRIFEKKVKDTLESFLNALYSLTPEDPSIANPNFRLCRAAFRHLVQQHLDSYREARSVTHSATDFLQRIVEDIYFGMVLRPFKVHARSYRASLCCIIMMGDIHGTTIFRLEDCSRAATGENESGGDQDFNGDSSDSDADYDPNPSDMEEESDDDDDDDDAAADEP
jgi:hypothetical protein